MQIEDRNKKLKHLITCMKCEVSGKICDANCPTQYEAGNMGEIIENLEAISKTLGQVPRWISVSEKLPEKSGNYWCTFGGTNLTGSDYYTTESDAKEMFDEPEEYIGWRSQNVIAWMSMPKHYEQ